MSRYLKLLTASYKGTLKINEVICKDTHSLFDKYEKSFCKFLSKIIVKDSIDLNEIIKYAESAAESVITLAAEFETGYRSVTDLFETIGFLVLPKEIVENLKPQYKDSEGKPVEQLQFVVSSFQYDLVAETYKYCNFSHTVEKRGG